jgi:NAD(P)-dependent dehydrogenase (short-subunit alcohol dehydrogenase family)
MNMDSTIDVFDRFRLDGKVALVTGASYGLGVLFAKTLAEAGADLVITARSVDRLDETKVLIESMGRRCLAVAGDVRNFADVENVVERGIAEYGKIDILVSNAGTGDPRGLPSELVEPEKFLEDLTTDLVGTWHACRAVGPHMLRRGSGSIITLSSILGQSGHEHRTAGYVTAKHGVNGLTKLLGVEWADRGVRVNALAPNYFLAESTRGMFESSGMLYWVQSRTPMRRMGFDEDLKGPLLFLASDASSYLSGAIIPVDGGWSASGGAAQHAPPFDGWNNTTPIAPPGWKRFDEES